MYAFYSLSFISSQRTQRNSGSEHESSPTWTIETHSWLDSQPLRLNSCNVSKIQQRALFSIYPNSPMSPSSSVTSTGFLLRPASNSWWQCWPSRPPAKLYPSTFKHWSDHRPQRLALLHQLTNWCCKQNLLSEVANLLCSGASVVEWTPDHCHDSGICTFMRLPLTLKS